MQPTVLNNNSSKIDHLLKAFSFAVQRRREHLGITQEELAHRCGLHRTYISDIERGGRNLSFKNLSRLAKGLEVSISTLVRWTELNGSMDLETTEAELRDYFHNAPCGYGVFDEGGNIVQINDTLLSWLGYSRQDLQGKNGSFLVSPDNQKELARLLEDLKASGQAGNVSLNMICQNGSVIPVLLNASAITNGAGELIKSKAVICKIVEDKN